MPQIKAQYIDTGKVYFVYRDLPLAEIHPGAILAAHIAGCAAEQGAFWPMHDRLFQGYEAREWSRGGPETLPIFLGYARELGLDEAALNDCVLSNRRAPLIEADVREALSRGLQSTPAFFVNGQPLLGAQPFEVFQQAFDQILEQQ
jgi:protein-disulfide isomerase